MTKYPYFAIAQAQAQTAVVTPHVTPQSQPKLWETELFQLSAMGGILTLLLLWASLSPKKSPLTSARMANRWDKLNATDLAFEHMKATANGKCSPSAAWCGTPRYSYKFLGLKWASRLQVMLHNTMPTTWIPDIGRGVLVLGSPGSGKTFSFIDRVLEALFAQSVSVLLYDKKGDQMKLHTSLASRYGYTVDVFAPGGVGLEAGEDPNTPGGDYTCVINVLDFMKDPRDATTAGELGKILIDSQGKGDGKKDFFSQTGGIFATGLMQLAKSSKYSDLVMVYAITQLPNLVERLDWAVRRNDEQKLDPWIAATISNFLSSKESEKTAASIKTTAEITFTGFIQNDLIPCMVGKSTIPLYLKPKQLLVMKLDDRRRSIIAPLITMCMHLTIVENLSQKRTNPFCYCVDEAPSLGVFAKLSEFINEYRSNGGIPIIAQSLNQFFELYGKERGKALVSGLFTHVLFGPNDSVTAEEYSKKMGNKTVTTTSVSRSRSQGGASTSVNQQTHQIPLISVDMIERFPQGKAIVLNPGYGDKNDVKRPIMGKIGVPKEDIDRAIEAETVIWKEKIRPVLANRKAQLVKSRQQHYIDLSKLSNTQKQDWTTEQLNLRLAAAEELLPMPPKEK
jgi:type IV secretion system protein VirD4